MIILFISVCYKLFSLCICFVSFCGQRATRYLLFYVSRLRKENQLKTPGSLDGGRVVMSVKETNLKKQTDLTQKK